MKKLICSLMGVAMIFVLASCAMSNAFDGTWKLVVVGESKVDPDRKDPVDVTITNHITFEKGKESGKIVREDGQYYLIDNESKSKYRISLRYIDEKWFMFVNTPQDDELFKGDDIVFEKIK